MSNIPPDLPPRGRFARVAVTAALDAARSSTGADFPPGVFIARPNLLIVSHGDHASVLRFESADDAGGLAVGLLALAQAMECDAAKAAEGADAALSRVLAERESAGNA